MTGKYFDWASKAFVVGIASLFLATAAGRHSLAQSTAGPEPQAIACVPNFNPSVVAQPGEDFVRIKFDNCVCADSSDEVKKIASEMLRGANYRGSTNAMTLSDIKDIRLEGEGTTTKTYYCYKYETIKDLRKEIEQAKSAK
jgi:hypothetical protein